MTYEDTVEQGAEGGLEDAAVIAMARARDAEGEDKSGRRISH